jgi:hypothetical protein
MRRTTTNLLFVLASSSHCLLGKIGYSTTICITTLLSDPFSFRLLCTRFFPFHTIMPSRKSSSRKASSRKATTTTRRRNSVQGAGAEEPNWVWVATDVYNSLLSMLVARHISKKDIKAWNKARSPLYEGLKKDPSLQSLKELIIAIKPVIGITEGAVSLFPSLQKNWEQRYLGTTVELAQLIWNASVVHIKAAMSACEIFIAQHR